MPALDYMQFENLVSFSVFLLTTCNLDLLRENQRPHKISPHLTRSVPSLASKESEVKKQSLPPANGSNQLKIRH